MHSFNQHIFYFSSIPNFLFCTIPLLIRLTIHLPVAFFLHLLCSWFIIFSNLNTNFSNSSSVRFLQLYNANSLFIISIVLLYKVHFSPHFVKVSSAVIRDTIAEVMVVTTLISFSCPAPNTLTEDIISGNTILIILNT